jgi:hypothetical protein
MIFSIMYKVVNAKKFKLINLHWNLCIFQSCLSLHMFRQIYFLFHGQILCENVISHKLKRNTLYVILYKQKYIF